MGFAKLILVEPNINEIPQGFAPQTTELIGLESALTAADVVVLLVDHKPFKEMDLGMLSAKQVVDTRGIWG
jgi:UDP-N-acetyl-D-mannosaminuronic acid dehydrogenase